MAKRHCEFFAHCNNTIADGSETGLCGQCYSALYYWNDKSIARKMKRMRLLEKCHARMEFMTGVTSAGAARARRKKRRVA